MNAGAGLLAAYAAYLVRCGLRQGALVDVTRGVWRRSAFTVDARGAIRHSLLAVKRAISFSIVERSRSTVGLLWLRSSPDIAGLPSGEPLNIA